MMSRHDLCGGLALALAALMMAGCGAQTSSGVTGTAEGDLGVALSALCRRTTNASAPERTGFLAADNGLTTNGIGSNGLCANGLGTKALLGANGNLADPAFAAWFNADPALADMLMRYLVSCIAPAHRTISWTNPSTKVVYDWPGGMGLAPGWAGGSAPTEAEQQVATACLAARVNKYGVHVPIAIEGYDANGTKLAVEPGELATYSLGEGCFFGNVFRDEGVYVGLDHGAWWNGQSSARACAFDVTATGTSTACPPLVQVDYCWSKCVRAPDGMNYSSCTHNGKSYKPLITRLRQQDIYTCGDGVCQFTEKCGRPYTNSADACYWDCGACK